MIDFETLMFIIAFGPVILIIVFVEVFLRFMFRSGYESENQKTPKEVIQD
jgi:TRAP-type C4-dicarboxylate transport system permease small subunit